MLVGELGENEPLGVSGCLSQEALGHLIYGAPGYNVQLPPMATDLRQPT